MKNKTLKRVLTLTIIAAQAALAETASQGYNLFKRVAGTIPTPAQAQAIASLAAQGNMAGIVSMATQTEEFGNVTALSIAERICNRVQDAPWNDCTFTVASGIVKDLDMRDVLWGNVLATSSTVPGQAPANNNNNHWNAISKTVNLQAAAIIGTQSGTYGLAPNVVGGVFTFRHLAEKHFNGGTNRSPWADASKYVLGLELKDTKSLAAPVDKIHPDVAYYNAVEPDPAKRIDNSCIGCHAQMDAVNSAFAYHNFVNNRTTISVNVVDKFPRFGTGNNNGFPGGTPNPSGFVPTNDAWSNYYLNNAAYGFRADPSRGLGTAQVSAGNGVAAWAKAVSQTVAFKKQLARFVIDIACNKPDYTLIQAQLNEVADAIEESGYNMKEGFAAASQLEHCIPSSI